MVGWVLATGLVAGVAQAEAPAFDPMSFKNAFAGKPTQVLVLGTTHLSGLQGFKPAYLAPVLDRLARYSPDIITIEGVSGPGCDALVRYKAQYPGVAEIYCASTEAAEKATGLTVPVAVAEAEATFAAWPAQPTSAQRRHLAAVLLAANDRASAVVQWLRLSPSERRIGDGVDETLVNTLRRLSAAPNENYQIAAVLAARLGLERVYAVDDHSADSITASLGPDFDSALKLVWSGSSPFKDTYKAKQAHLTSGDDMLDLYRYLNLPESQLAAIRGDFGAALKQQTPALYGRQYVAWWEARNLRMVANIRAAFGNHPGARVLSIVGSSHKAYFDAYLNLLHDVELVNAEDVLR